MPVRSGSHSRRSSGASACEPYTEGKEVQVLHHREVLVSEKRCGTYRLRRRTWAVVGASRRCRPRTRCHRLVAKDRTGRESMWICRSRWGEEAEDGTAREW
jgi:hypothetical protein